MSNASISDSFATQLQAMREQTLAQLREQRGGDLSRADAAADRRASESDDWAQASTEHYLSVALSERESAELLAIAAALQRIQDGSFGLCLDCCVAIPTARLHANPTALRCVGCQERLEGSGRGQAMPSL
jgi:DnaK suppressor protein